MAAGEHTGTAFYDSRWLFVLLPLRRSTIYEESKTIRIEKHPNCL